MIDIANSFHKNGFECSLIAGRVVCRDTTLNSGIIVQKIKKYDRTSNIKRIKSWLIGSIQILYHVIFKYRSWHLFIVSNPPFATLLPLFLRNQFSLMVFDVFPDAFTDFGILKPRSLINIIWVRANRKVYKRADHIYTLTAGMKQALAQYIDPEKIKIIPLWTSNNFLKPVPKNKNPFIIKHNLDGKFVVLYSGNFGIAHYIDLIIDIASKTTEERIMFVLVGGGPRENDIKLKITSRALKNCVILPWQDIDTLPYSLASADLSVVTLSENALKLGIPSKVFSYMAAGTPILCITGSGSELEKLVLDYNVGQSFRPSQFEEMINYISELSNNPSLCKLYHENSLKASTYHTLQNVDHITQRYV